jgi:hypothetical protein
VGFGVVVKGRMVKGRGGHEYGKRLELEVLK